MPDPKTLAFKDAVIRHFNQIAPVSARSMFGGYGLYLEGTMFALIAYEKLYFKVDDRNRADFEKFAMEPFTYNRNGKPVEMSYYRLPEDIYDDLGLLQEWLEKATEVARRSKTKRRRSS
jgi:DNA transformation protein